MKKLLLLLPLVPLFAADPAGFLMWKSGDLKSIKESAKLEDFGNHSGRPTFRDKSGQSEVHQGWTDILIIESGDATIAIGGTQVNPKTTGPGEMRADSATGARKIPVKPGDILNIPAGVSHQFLLEPGKTVAYFAIKVPAK
jgi:mannose-6-phosphate isomerase-like protein (cupin superfamily)